MTVLLTKVRERRSVLKGVLGGSAVTVALPFLDGDLNVNGTALAATGAALPVRFGTFYWGMGHTPGHAITEKSETSKGIGFLAETEALKPFEDDLNFFGAYAMPLDGRSNYTHYTGWVASRTGTAPAHNNDIPAPTFDLLIADAIAGNSRFFTLNANAVGMPRANYSARSTASRAAAEISAAALYQRLFGPEFVDPNNSEFKPDPRVMVQKSVLSGAIEQSRDYIKTLGAADKSRLDEYFTSVRQVENQLALQLQKPPPNDACLVPPAVTEKPMEEVKRIARDMDEVIETHGVMAKLFAMAVACNQTKVFNMAFTDDFANVRRVGETYTHHLLTHEEPLDQKLGYQPLTFWFNKCGSDGFAAFLKEFKSIREGDGTLLDNCLIHAGSETNYARVHTIDGVPFWLAGKAGGRMKTGYHVVGGADPVTRIGLTAMTAMGVPVESWGTKSLKTTKPITEVLNDRATPPPVKTESQG
ncbi:MAG: DUF1552 domain-containing protein [Alphaproteobacteria bacterium]|nr:DUF1552 domain-containing protein [Alphaproteobacteria bacterium]